ncbi:MAG: FtsX-like permease family protein [Trebonia sp.]
MYRLAWLSLRQRFGASAVTFLNVFLGGAILTGFASLYTTGTAHGVSAADQQTLTTMSWVIGSWGLLIVAFGVASTLNLTVRQRTGEIALLKSAGATPAQAGRLVRGEAVLVCLAAALPAVILGYAAGLGMVDALKGTHQIARSVAFTFGPYAIGSGLADTFLAAFIAAWFTSRRLVRLSTVQALTAATVEAARIGRKRLIAGIVFVLIGADCGTLTLTVLKGQGFTTMSVAGEGCIQSAIGLALLAPALMRAAAAAAGPVLRGLGLSGYLAGTTVRQRTSQSAGLLMPVILFVSLATGALYIQLIMNSAQHGALSANDKGVQTLSFVVTGIIAVFAAVVVANIAVATTLARAREFGQQRLLGTTPKQVRQAVALETAVTVAAGLALGTVSAAIGVIPFSIAQAHRAIPAVSPGVYLGVAVTVIVITYIAILTATSRTLRRPALAAVAAAGLRSVRDGTSATSRYRPTPASCLTAGGAMHYA